MNPIYWALFFSWTADTGPTQAWVISDEKLVILIIAAALMLAVLALDCWLESRKP